MERKIITDQNGTVEFLDKCGGCISENGISSSIGMALID